jgi:uroporphyrin-3 C-methyltransferase
MNEEEIEVAGLEEETLEIDSPEEITTEPRPKGGRNWVAVIALLALLGTAAGLGVGYILWQKLIQSEALSQQLQENITTQQGQLKTLGQMLETAQDHTDTMAEEVKLLQKQMAQRAALDNKAHPLRAEVSSLLRIANRRLRFAGDIDTAVKALREADTQLRDSGDPAWIPVREQIAINLATLGGIKRVDLSGLSLRLSALSKQVSTLKPLMATVPAVPEPKEATGEGSSRKFSWDTMLQDSWEALRSLLVIRRHDRPVPVLLPPKQIYFLKQNLQLRLQTAQLALLQRDQALYADNLEQAANWLQEHFGHDQVAVKSMLDEISALRQEQIAPTLPDTSGSLRLLLGQDLDSNQTEKPAPSNQTERAPSSEAEEQPPSNQTEEAPNSEAEELQP